MGGAVSTGEDNDELTDNLVNSDYIKCDDIAHVFRAVDRGHYFTKEYKDNAYKDLAWKNGNLHLSAPCIYSEVLESINLKPGNSFLNLGSGTGYLSTMAGLMIGCSGVNHGIELHSDVVDYAELKLQEWTSTATAFDQYEFCEPSFTVGNCLNLHPETRLYDRIYVGAACPEGFQEYMKRFLKIGGILVMPFNEHLQKITRHEDSYDIKNVMPVSFASLVTPQKEANSDVILPDIDPNTLMALCRVVVRRSIRHKLERDHPLILNRKTATPQKKSKKSNAGLGLIPIFQMATHQSDSPLLLDSDDEEEEVGPGETGRDAANQLSSVLAFARSLARHHSEINAQCSGESEQQEMNIDTEQQERSIDTEQQESTREEVKKKGRKSTRETTDSGLGDELPKPSSEDEETMNIDSDSDFEEPPPLESPSSSTPSRRSYYLRKVKNIRSIPFRPRKQKQSPSAIWKKVAQDGDSETEEEVKTVSVSDSNFNNYSDFMKRRIKQLPVPSQIHSYINYYRDF